MKGTKNSQKKVPNCGKLYWVLFSIKLGKMRFLVKMLAAECANGRGRSGGQTVLRELESACRVSVLRDAVTVPTVCFSGVLLGSPEGSAAVSDPNPPRPFARYRFSGAGPKKD